jgi:hypothetical protein
MCVKYQLESLHLFIQKQKLVMRVLFSSFDLYIYDLCNNAVSSSYFMPLNERVINE